jgi:signal transduction histidine kinase/ActR/RegA family two-component response regulator
MVSSHTQLEVELRESLESLAQKNQQERQRRLDTDVILEGSHKLSLANSLPHAVEAYLDLLHRFVEFENAVFLRAGDVQWKVDYASHDALRQMHWLPSHFSERLLLENISVLFRPASIKEFALLPGDVLTRFFGSAIVIGIRTEMNSWLLVLGHPQSKAFAHEHKRSFKRLRPLLAQRLMNLEYQDQLKTMVAKRTEALRRSEQRFMSFAQTASDWFWETDDQFLITFLSSALEDGRDSIFPDLCGIDFFALRSQQEQSHLPKWLAFEKQISSREKISDFRFEMHAPEQPLRWMALNGEPYFDAMGHYAGYRGGARDITQEMRDQAALKQAKEDAERAYQAKSEFLATMSHEIRTPMNAIVGMIDLLSDAPLENQSRGLLDNAKQASGLLLNIINDVLDYSKFEVNGVQLEIAPFKPSAVVKSVVSQLQEMANKKLLYLVDESTGDVGIDLLGDASRLTQVLLNLVTNSIKFTEQGQVDVLLVVSSVSSDRCHLQFKIQDTGIGIAADDIRFLFEPFKQLNQSHARVYGGTGLGLAITKRIVDAMGGTLSVESEQGRGSCFYVDVVFPLVRHARQPEALPTMPSIEVMQPLNILVVEDSASNRLIVRLMLEKLGHTVELVENGEKALAITDWTDFDAILMDIQMPGIDGLEATVRLRQRGVAVPIIALTANVMVEDRWRCQEAGMDDFIGKPLKSSELKRKLLKVIASGESRQNG